MIEIFYKPNIITSFITGNTNIFSSNVGIESDVYISSGFTLNINNFYGNSITRLDIIDNVINYVTGGINKYMLDLLIVDSGQTYIDVNNIGIYCIKISYENDTLIYLIMNISTEDYIPPTVIYEIPLTTTTTTTLAPTTTTTTTNISGITLYYKSIVYNTTGNTNNFYNLTPNVNIFSGFTLNINSFDNNTITRLDIIDNIINYVTGINKYMLNLLIVDSGQTYIEVNNIGTYCIKIYYNIESFYLIMIVSDEDYILPIVTTETTPIIDTSYENSGINDVKPIIYYNSSPLSGASWLGSGTTVPYNVILDLIHDGITGWTLESLKYLFIDKVVGCFDGQLSLDNIVFELNDGFFNLTGITNSGVYNIVITVTDSAGNITINNISNITVDNEPPVIVYYPYIFMNITGSTNIFSGASSGITPNIYIPSGFTFNLNEFDQNLINRLDIINNIVSYAYDKIDLDVNKYKIDILISGKHNANYIIYTGITNPGYYCIKFTLTDKYDNSIEQYFMMFVTYDVSVYSEGYWQDNKVWIDFTLWLDHPKIPR